MITDVDGFKWEDKRLHQPEHFVAMKDGFEIELKEAVGNASHRWNWSVTLIDSHDPEKSLAAHGPAMRKESAIEFAKDAIRVLERARRECDA